MTVHPMMLFCIKCRVGYLQNTTKEHYHGQLYNKYEELDTGIQGADFAGAARHPQRSGAHASSSDGLQLRTESIRQGERGLRPAEIGRYPL